MATEGYTHKPAYDSGYLPVGKIHVLHYEQYGNPNGKPALFLHGGPGGSTSIANAVFFNPEIYRVVLFDQRGTGQSKPSAEIRENTSQLLVHDIEALRDHLGIRKWHLVFGGSWGSFLSLLYAQTHPEAVGSIIIRGILTGRQKELDFHRGPLGSAMLFPEAYERFLNELPLSDRTDHPMDGYIKLLQSSDPAIRRSAARQFNAWDIWTNQIEAPDDIWGRLDDDKFCIEHALLECHYFTNGCFIEEGELLRKENVDKIRHIPGTIVQGQYDICCPPDTAWELHKKWPEAEYYVVPRSGHTIKEPLIFERLVAACDEYAKLEAS